MNPNLDPLLLLAAGRSSRMGEPKGLVAYQGRPWIEAQLERFAEAQGTEAIIVLGFDREKYLEALPWLKSDSWRSLKIQVVMNPDPDRGPFSSLQAGIERLDTKNAFLLPIDVPAPSPEVWQALKERPGIQVIQPRLNGKNGHPIWLAQSFLKNLLNLDPGTSRLDHQIHALEADKKVSIDVTDPRILLNLNTREDFTRL